MPRSLRQRITERVKRDHMIRAARTKQKSVFQVDSAVSSSVGLVVISTPEFQQLGELSQTTVMVGVHEKVYRESD